MPSIKAKTLQNLTERESAYYFPRKNLENINGETISKTRQRNRYNIMRGQQRLVEKGIGRYADASETPSPSLSAEATALLGALGASVDSTKSKDYSLINTQTDQEVINNPNIADRNLKSMKGQQTSPDDKFSDPDDPFYNLDDGLSEQEQLQVEEAAAVEVPSQALQTLAADISVINIDGQYETKGLQLSI
jgi:hypothetical protein